MGAFKSKIKKFIKENLIVMKVKIQFRRSTKAIVCIKSFESQGNLKLVLQNGNFKSKSCITNLPHIVETLI